MRLHPFRQTQQVKRPHVALIYPQSRCTMEITMPARSSPNSDHPIENPGDHVPSLGERAAAAARAELRGDRAGILGAVSASPLPLLLRPRRVPERWSFIHVMERLEEAFRILGRLPTQTRPRGYINSMPFYLHDRADLNSQIETRELERVAQLRNRVRILPSPAEIARMEEALRWPTAYLSDAEFHHVARAVNLGALWAAVDADVARGLRRINLTRRVFNARKLQGLRIITQELICRRIPIR
jgi:hypothetical protein